MEIFIKEIGINQIDMEKVFIILLMVEFKKENIKTVKEFSDYFIGIYQYQFINCYNYFPQILSI